MKTAPHPTIRAATALTLLLATPAFGVDGTYDDLTVNGVTKLKGEVRIDDTGATTAGQWNLTLQNGLFVHGAPGVTDPLNLDYNSGDSVFFWYPEKSAFRAGTATDTSHDENSIGENSFAFGDGAEATRRSIAIGSNAQATSGDTVAIGANARAIDDITAALGVDSKANGIGSVALGAYSWATGEVSVAVGLGAAAPETHSTALGFLATSNARESTALGSEITTESFASLVAGSFPVVGGTADQWLESEELFVLGNGESGSARSNALRTLKNGRTRLINKFWDSASPLADPSATDDSGGEALVVDGHSRFRGKVVLEEPQGDVSMGAFTP